MGKFKKGISGNPDGRPQGSKNKTTSELKKMINELFNEELEYVKLNLKKLEPKERLDFMVKLLPYVLPKQYDINDSQSQKELYINVPDWLKPSNTSIESNYEN